MSTTKKRAKGHKTKQVSF